MYKKKHMQCENNKKLALMLCGDQQNMISKGC